MDRTDAFRIPNTRKPMIQIINLTFPGICRRKLISLFLLIAVFIPFPRIAEAQNAELDIYACLDSSVVNMPILRQKPFLAEILENKLKTYSNLYLPAFAVNGQATLQSHVPNLPFSLPGTPSLDIPKNQYRAWIEINQPIYDGGFSKAQKEVEFANNSVSLLQLDAGAFEYKKQVAQVFFQVLLAENQQEILKDVLILLNGKKKTSMDAAKNGVLQENDILKIEVEILNQERKIKELEQAIMSGKEVLSLMTGVDVSGRKLKTPINKSIENEISDLHPELKLISLQQINLAANRSLILVQRKPKISFFGQAGVGAPNPYNFFKSKTSAFYYAGLRINWTLWDWGKTSRETGNLQLVHHLLAEQKSQKTLELKNRMIRLENDSKLIIEQLEIDKNLVKLRKQIRENSANQLKEGIITLIQYNDEVLAEEQALIGLTIDEISLIRIQFLIQFENGTL